MKKNMVERKWSGVSWEERAGFRVGGGIDEWRSEQRKLNKNKNKKSRERRESVSNKTENGWKIFRNERVKNECQTKGRLYRQNR